MQMAFVSLKQNQLIGICLCMCTETEQVQGRSIDPFFEKISAAMERIEIHIKENSGMESISEVLTYFVHVLSAAYASQRPQLFAY